MAESDLFGDCNRCGEYIEPGTSWDLGHDELNPAQWTGPEHVSCTRAPASQQDVEAVVI